MRPIFFILLIILTLVIAPTFSFASELASTIEGTITQVSQLPAAEASPYPDCYYTASFDVKSIRSGETVPPRIILVLGGFFSRRYAPEAGYKAGDKVRATIVPLASMPDNVRQTQQADDIEELDLPFYFVQKVSTIADFAPSTISTPLAEFAKSSQPNSTSRPLDAEAKTARQSQMQRDLDEINKLLSRHGGDWKRWVEQTKAIRDDYKNQHEKQATKWIGNSFFSAGKVDSGEIYSDEFVESVVKLKTYLAARNVDLILVRIPNKGEIVDDLFVQHSDEGVLNPHLLKFYKQLLDADVEIITDIIPAANKDRLKYPLMYYYQDFEEGHPAEGMAWTIAQEFARRVSRYKVIDTALKVPLALKPSPDNFPITDSWQSIKWPTGNAFNPAEQVRFSTVIDSVGKPLEIKYGTTSPVLIVGSSYIISPSVAQGGSMPHYFAYVSGIVPDILQRRDADYMVPRMLAREKDDFYANRVVCLFPFVPWLPYKGLAPVPVINAISSQQKLLADYDGQQIKSAIEPISNRQSFSYLSNGTLQLAPGLKDKEGAVTFSVKLPEAIAQYPYFVLSLGFNSPDHSALTVQYEQQVDKSKRDRTKVNADEVFAFASKSSRRSSVTVTAEKGFLAPVNIRSIRVYGVEKASIQ